MLEAVYEMNACVPYSGVSTTARLDESAVACVLALLPPALSPGMSSASNLSEEESKQVGEEGEEGCSACGVKEFRCVSGEGEKVCVTGMTDIRILIPKSPFTAEKHKGQCCSCVMPPKKIHMSGDW